ncbi:MAG: hypothetical protein WCI20_07320 [bacterium]
MAAFLFLLAFVHLRAKYGAAWTVSETPQIVYWVCARDLPRRIARYGMRNFKVLTLYLRDGSQCEAYLAPTEVDTFRAWLTERNPTVRWGAYDASP